MHRFWSVLFYLVPVLGTLSLMWAILGIPPMENHWLPKNVNTMGEPIDHLFYVILIVTGIIFIGTGLVLGWFLWKYAETSNQSTTKFVHGNKKAELIWSVIPAIILVLLSFYQIRPWVDVTIARPTINVNGVEEPKPPTLKVIARQFNWDFQYPGPDGVLETEDDFLITDQVCVVPVDEAVVVQIESTDVLHSFFIPELRVKQDIVPGMVQFVWFHANAEEDCEIACTELCGWGHYKMKAKMRIVSREEFDAWLLLQHNRQHHVAEDLNNEAANHDTQRIPHPNRLKPPEERLAFFRISPSE